MQDEARRHEKMNRDDRLRASIQIPLPVIPLRFQSWFVVFSVFFCVQV